MIPRKNMLDFFNDYREDNPKAVDIATFRAIFNGFVKFIVQKVFDGYDVQLSTNHSLGSLAIHGRRVEPRLDNNGEIRGAAPNWHESKKIWRRLAEEQGLTYEEYCDSVPLENRPKIFFLNSHSNYTRYSFKWRRTKMNMMNKLYYSLVMCRTNKRTSSRLVREGKEYYTIMHKTLKIKDHGIRTESCQS